MSPASGAARVGPETARTEEELCTAEAANGAEYIFGWLLLNGVRIRVGTVLLKGGPGALVTDPNLNQCLGTRHT